jgi:hypothetical protein
VGWQHAPVTIHDDPATAWDKLDIYLGGLTGRLGGAAYLFGDSGKVQLSPPEEHGPSFIARFERAYQTLEETFGQDCLARSTSKQHLHRQADNWFVAEPVLAAYHLIVLFNGDFAPDQWMAHLLDHERPVLEDLVTDLPPLDDGTGRAAAQRRP